MVRLFETNFCAKGEFRVKSFKPEMSIESAKQYLQEIQSGDISVITPIEMGELSRVFSYRKGDQELVIHFKSSRESLDKAKWIYDRYARVLPVPRLVEVGTLGHLHYSITEKVQGKPIITLAKEDIVRLIPELIERFGAMNRIRVDDSAGYGWISPSGEASFASWTEFLASTFKEEQEGFYEGWTSLFDNGFLERDLFEDMYGIMIDLARYAPQERYLVHGDFHLGNMLSDGRGITGIVDWEMAMYGDFMFDAAVLHLWVPQLQFPQRLREAWEEKGQPIPHFDRRLLCYQMFKGVDGLRFYAKKGDKPGYEFIKDRLLSLARGTQG
ncbi:MAG: aminoglycoside phosphotransferase [Paenibacillus sp.]|nr:aminoglycoside phosphotransferase [Paenibacillus sp.]